MARGRVGGRWWVPPLLVLLLGAALSMAIVLAGAHRESIMLVNLTRPIAPGVEAIVDYRVHYAVIGLTPEDSIIGVDIAANCSEAGREVILGGQGASGVIDLSPGEAVCRVYASNENLALSYLPPSAIDVRKPGVLDFYFQYPPGGSPLLNGLVRLEFQVQEVVLSVGNETLSGVVRFEWVTRQGSVFQEYTCDAPCDIRAEPGVYSTSFNVYLDRGGFMWAYPIAASLVASAVIVYVLRVKR